VRGLEGQRVSEAERQRDGGSEGQRVEGAGSGSEVEGQVSLWIPDTEWILGMWRSGVYA
jgi:hypothetical protein